MFWFDICSKFLSSSFKSKSGKIPDHSGANTEINTKTANDIKMSGIILVNYSSENKYLTNVARSRWQQQSQGSMLRDPSEEYLRKSI